MFDSIKFEKYSNKDIYEYANFKKEFLSDIWTQQYHKHFIDAFKLNKNQRIILAKKEGKIIGQLFVEFKDNIAYIEEIEVSSKFQKKGIGKNLIKVFKNLYEDIPLELLVDKDNTKAIDFYKKLGFELVENNPKTLRFGLSTNREVA